MPMVHISQRAKPFGAMTMPKHDENTYTAYNAGQNDCIAKRPCNPANHQIFDGHRIELYFAGYEMELKDLQTYLQYI